MIMGNATPFYVKTSTLHENVQDITTIISPILKGKANKPYTTHRPHFH